MICVFDNQPREFYTLCRQRANFLWKGGFGVSNEELNNQKRVQDVGGILPGSTVW